MYHFINDNFHTYIATVPPSYKMKHFHEHNRWELMFIYSGSCTLYVGDEIYMLNSGGLALIPPGMAHMTTYLAGSNHTRYVLYFNNDELEWIADDSSQDIESIFHKHPVIHIPERRLDYISSIIQKISYEHNGVDSLSLSFIHS
ncbi:MAG: AraC family ligand binding domain-containing protein, partial [Lachnospira sp.]|nr:AraC family ligand binding domain-containing protein [Lachnospira sp.]